MPRRKTPETFDEHLGSVVDGAIRRHGGREAAAQWLPISFKSLERRLRGENGFLVSELRIIAEHTGWSVGELVDRALKDYGGIDKLIAESVPVSEPIPSLDEERKRRQKIAAGMTLDEIESPTTRKIAEQDDERREDEPLPT